MHEIRIDAITGCEVIIADQRSRRPLEFAEVPRGKAGFVCPFCESREGETSEEVLAVRQPGTAPNSPGWRVRVVKNLYPALTEGPLSPPDESLLAAQPAAGGHEVVIESPRHVTSISQVSVADYVDVLWCFRERLRWWRDDASLPYAMFFKNVGAAGGASLQHSHSQIVALPFVPQAVQLEHYRAEEYFARHRRTAMSAVIDAETEAGTRMLSEGAQFASFCPFASRFAYEMWIAPRRPQPQFALMEDSELDALAAILHDAICRLDAHLNRPAYNVVLHTFRFDTKQADYYHWHIRIAPRTAKIAGFELGTGCYFNSMPPEEAAKALRACLPTCGTAGSKGAKTAK